VPCNLSGFFLISFYAAGERDAFKREWDQRRVGRVRTDETAAQQQHRKQNSV